jgi:hypothetical protein
MQVKNIRKPCIQYYFKGFRIEKGELSGVEKKLNFWQMPENLYTWGCCAFS